MEKQHSCAFPAPQFVRVGSTWSCFCGRRYRLNNVRQWTLFSLGGAFHSTFPALMSEANALLDEPSTLLIDGPGHKAETVLDLSMPLEEGQPLPLFITIDNHRFARETLLHAFHWFALYLAGRARNGDVAAQNWLIALNVKIIDLDGLLYWPMSDEDRVSV